MTHFKKYWYWYLLGIIAFILIVYNWNTIIGWFSSEPEQDTAQRTIANGNPELRLDIIPKANLSQLSAKERQIVSALFNETNKNGASQAAIDRANAQLASIGSGINFSNNNSAARAKCKEGYDCWSLNLIIFTMCRCKSYPTPEK